MELLREYRASSHIIGFLCAAALILALNLVPLKFPVILFDKAIPDSFVYGEDFVEFSIVGYKPSLRDCDPIFEDERIVFDEQAGEMVSQYPAEMRGATGLWRSGAWMQPLGNSLQLASRQPSFDKIHFGPFRFYFPIIMQRPPIQARFYVLHACGVDRENIIRTTMGPYDIPLPSRKQRRRGGDD